MKKTLSIFFLLLLLAMFNFQHQPNEQKAEQQAKSKTESPSATDTMYINKEKPTENKKISAKASVADDNDWEKRSGWKLIWHDEFEQGYLSSNNWNVENWAAEKNNELQYYLPENVTVKDGFLHLVSKKENYQGRHYTSGAVHSKDKFEFLFGKAEIRAKLPAGKGIFPAFWMMPGRDNRWLPEIDIFEMLGDKPTEIWMVSHWLGNEGQLVSDSTSYKAEHNFAEGFHTYSVEWTPDQITWLIDGQIRFQSTKHIPKEEMYLYLNTAIGGNWPGNPNESTFFPQTFQIDYVRVYKQEEGGI